MYRISLIFVLLFSFCLGANAQPVLPDVGVMTQGGINVLSWSNPYSSGVKTVVVERSLDSIVNFSTVGEVNDISKPTQYYLDAHPYAGNNYYRIKVVFSSGLDWKSKVASIFVDSTELAARKVLPSNDSLQKIIAQMGTLPTEQQLNQLGYTPSPYVFTNPYNGNINISLSDALSVSYKLVFYDNNDRQVLEIPRINDEEVVLDKRNFQRSGLYKFRLFKNNSEYADGMISIY